MICEGDTTLDQFGIIGGTVIYCILPVDVSNLLYTPCRCMCLMSW